MRFTKKLSSILLTIAILVCMMPSAMLEVFAWEEYIECEFCGEGCGDEYICSCGDHCSEASGRDCYDEHHCSECNDVAELCGGTEGCGRCYDCGGYCSVGNSHQCLECHLEYDAACPDCGQCWIDEDTICKKCLGCIECLGYCEGGDHLLCIDCHEDEEICSGCNACYVGTDINKCDSCYLCEDCAVICPECNLCENCVVFCENCGEMCVECHEADGETCPECGFCYFGEIYCQYCGVCYNCEYICPDCELCCDCYGDYHCVECGECFEVNGQCETGGGHCVVCCENNGWLCPECGECIEESGATVCRDCGACENCTEICGFCGDFCIECAKFEERLHCGECGECFESNALMHCADCYLCENCTKMCPECWDYCVDCGVKSEMHCPDCKGCYYLYEKCQGGCGKCSNCADDFCDICHQCGDCAFEYEDHCIECGNCFKLDGREYGTCWDCMKCSDCLGDEYCWACGGCNDCMAIYWTDCHCKECHLCFSDDVDSCENGCGYCVNCCKCLFLSTVTFDANGGSGTMSPENVFDAYKLPNCEFSPPTIGGKWMFIGWKIGNSLYNAGDIVIIKTDTTVTAMWIQVQPLSYVVVYNGNGGHGTMTPKTGVSGSFILPNCGYTPPAGKQFKAYYINGVYYQPGDVINVRANTVVSIIWKNVPMSATVSGTVTNFGNETYDITIELYEEGSASANYTVTVKGSTVEYSIKGVEFGTYTLKIQCDGCATAEYLVQITELENYYSFNLYQCGDVNADGKLNATDYMMLKAIVLGNKAVEDLKEQPSAYNRCDYTGDGKINAADYLKLKKALIG